MSSRLDLFRRAGGFTLVEVLVVIAVIAVLASVVSPMVFRNVSDAKQASARTQIEVFALALDAFRLDVGRYPTTEEGLAYLREAPDSLEGWRGPYLRKAIPADPWRNPYLYKSPGELNPDSYDLVALGRDGQPGGIDEAADIESWK